MVIERTTGVIGDFGTVHVAHRWQESPIAGAGAADRRMEAVR